MKFAVRIALKQNTVYGSVLERPFFQETEGLTVITTSQFGQRQVLVPVSVFTEGSFIKVLLKVSLITADHVISPPMTTAHPGSNFGNSWDEALEFMFPTSASPAAT